MTVAGEMRPYHHGALRTALLEAAETVLTERGSQGFTLRECARRAGVSHAAPAHHFGDVAGLLTALAQAGFDRLAATIAAERDTAPPGDARARLAAAGRGYVRFACEWPQLFRLMFGDGRLDRADPALAAAGHAAFTLLIDAVTAAHPGTTSSDPDVRSRTVRAWALVHGLAFLVLDGQLDSFTKGEPGGLDAVVAAVLERGP